LRANRPHIICRDIPDSLAESGQARESALTGVFIQPAFLVQAASQAHHFLDSINDPEFTVFSPGNQEVKAVASKVNRGIGLCLFLSGHIGDTRVGKSFSLVGYTQVCHVPGFKRQAG
jgi:hypothetical protein